MVTREEVVDEFTKLNGPVQQDILNRIMGNRQEYLMSKTLVDFPQFFFACNMAVFNGVPEEDLKEFKEIDDSQEFITNAVWYMIQFANTQGKR